MTRKLPSVIYSIIIVLAVFTGMLGSLYSFDGLLARNAIQFDSSSVLIVVAIIFCSSIIGVYFLYLLISQSKTWSIGSLSRGIRIFGYSMVIGIISGLNIKLVFILIVLIITREYL